MEFQSGNYLYRKPSRVLQKPRPASLLPSVPTGAREAQDFQLHRQRIEDELEIITTERLSISRHNSCKYATVTVPSSVRHLVTERPLTSTMARPRSPQKKNEEYLQGLLDEQLSVIRQQLVGCCACYLYTILAEHVEWKPWIGTISYCAVLLHKFVSLLEI